MDPMILNLLDENHEFDVSVNFKMLKTEKYLIVFYIKNNSIILVSKAYLDGIEMKFRYDKSISNSDNKLATEIVYQNESVTQKKLLNLKFYENNFFFKVQPFSENDQPNLQTNKIYALQDLFSLQGNLLNINIFQWNISDVDKKIALGKISNQKTEKTSIDDIVYSGGFDSKMKLFNRLEKLSIAKFNAFKIQTDKNILVYLTAKGMESEFIE